MKDEAQDPAFQREAYLSLADEFDSFARDERYPAPTLDDFDAVYVEAARLFGQRLHLPFPPLDGIDHALDVVQRAESMVIR